ncbi:MAG: hypothetical protein H6622_09230 [Halobacteriovoraceae bacterium]|nr:hypothetical protein [Halobacteriovoraceae bacterium]
MGNNSHFSRLIELSLNELTVIKVTKDINKEISDYKDYADILRFYLSGNIEKLRKKVDQLEKECPQTLMAQLGRLRLQTRLNEVDDELIKNLEEKIESSDHLNDYKGEVYFVIGQAFAVKKEYKLAKDTFYKAYESLKELGSSKKANKALLNSIVSENLLDKNKNFNLEYNYIVNRSLALGDTDMAGIATANMAKEYYEIGSFIVAIKYFTQALEYMKNDRGTSHYYLTMAHRALAYLKSGEIDKGLTDYEMAKIAPFKVVKEFLNDIQTYLIENRSDHKISDYILNASGVQKISAKNLDNNILNSSNY